MQMPTQPDSPAALCSALDDSEEEHSLGLRLESSSPASEARHASDASAEVTARRAVSVAC